MSTPKPGNANSAKAAKNTPLATEEGIDSLRLTDDQWYRILDKLDRESSFHAMPTEARKAERVPYRNVARVPLTITGQGGDIQRLLVRPRDLSRNGFGFLHGHYVHPGLRASIILVNAANGPETIDGTVRRCNHLTKHIHQVGMAFDQPIHVEDYLLYVDQQQAG